MDPTVIISSLSGLVFPIFFVSVLVYRYRRERQLHETITRLVEKGLPVPKELFPIQSAPKWRLFGALTLIGLGVGLIIYFCTQPQIHVGAQVLDFNDWGIGAIPLAIGLAQLLAWKLEQPKSETTQSNSQE